MTTITLRDVTIAHDGRSVLRAVDLTAPAGEVTALLGPSGSGKTSLLRAVAGLTPPTSGRVLFGDEDVTAVPSAERELSYVPQGAPLLPTRDVAGNLTFPLEVRGIGRDEATDQARVHAGRFGIRSLFRRRPRSLSSGEQAATGIARSLVRRPRALLLDEPVPHLDPANRARVLARITAYQREYAVTLVVATNDVHVAEVLADRVAVIGRGTVLRVGTLEELRRDPGTTLAADLVAHTPMQWLSGVLAAGPRPDEVTVATAAGPVVVPDGRLRAYEGPVLVGIGPGDGVVAPRGTASLTGRTVRVATTGPRRLLFVATAAGQLVLDAHGDGWLPDDGEAVDVDVRRVHVATTAGDIVAVVG